MTWLLCKQGARHVAKDIAGRGIANPTAALLAGAMMLRHLNLPDFSDRRARGQLPPSPCQGALRTCGKAAVCMELQVESARWW